MAGRESPPTAGVVGVYGVGHARQCPLRARLSADCWPRQQARALAPAARGVCRSSGDRLGHCGRASISRRARRTPPVWRLAVGRYGRRHGTVYGNGDECLHSLLAGQFIALDRMVAPARPTDPRLNCWVGAAIYSRNVDDCQVCKHRDQPLVAIAHRERRPYPTALHSQ